MKNIKIGNKTFTGVEYISCACAEEEGVQRNYIDVDDTMQASVEGTTLVLTGNVSVSDTTLNI